MALREVHLKKSTLRKSPEGKDVCFPQEVESLEK